MFSIKEKHKKNKKNQKKKLGKHKKTLQCFENRESTFVITA